MFKLHGVSLSIVFSVTLSEVILSELLEISTQPQIIVEPQWYTFERGKGVRPRLGNLTPKVVGMVPKKGLWMRLTLLLPLDLNLIVWSGRKELAVGILPAGIVKVRLLMTLWIHVDKTPMKDPGEGSGKNQSIRSEPNRQGSGQDSRLGKEEPEHGKSKWGRNKPIKRTQ